MHMGKHPNPLSPEDTESESVPLISASLDCEESAGPTGLPTLSSEAAKATAGMAMATTQPSDPKLATSLTGESSGMVLTAPLA